MGWVSGGECGQVDVKVQLNEASGEVEEANKRVEGLASEEEWPVADEIKFGGGGAVSMWS